MFAIEYKRMAGRQAFIGLPGMAIYNHQLNKISVIGWLQASWALIHFHLVCILVFHVADQKRLKKPRQKPNKQTMDQSLVSK